MKELCSLIAVVLVCIIALSACGKEQTRTCEGDVDGRHVLTSIAYRDDKVLEQSTINTIRYDGLGMDRNEAKKLSIKSESIFKDLKGVKHKANYKDKRTTEHLNIDYAEVDMKESNKRLGVSTRKSRNISSEKLEKQLKHRGSREKDKMDDK